MFTCKQRQAKNEVNQYHQLLFQLPLHMRGNCPHDSETPPFLTTIGTQRELDLKSLKLPTMAMTISPPGRSEPPQSDG